MIINVLGEGVLRCWNEIPRHFAMVELDEFVLMPNHLHGVVRLGCGPKMGAMNRAPTVNADDGVGAQFIAPALGEVIRRFKARSAWALRKECGFSWPVWQRNYHEHVIRSEKSLQAIREYIRNNPMHWALDRENPDRVR